MSSNSLTESYQWFSISRDPIVNWGQTYSSTRKLAIGYLLPQTKLFYYQNLIGSISWLAHSTRPDLSTVHSFLSAYSNKPSTGHMTADLNALHYTHSTHDYGISFTSDNIGEMHSFIHFPLSSDVRAYQDVTSKTCWLINSLILQQRLLGFPDW